MSPLVMMAIMKLGKKEYLAQQEKMQKQRDRRAWKDEGPLNLPEIKKTGNPKYYASPKDSDRGRSFRQAYFNAMPGQDFMFEGLPYAGAPVLPPSQQVQQYHEEPPGGWTGGIDPNVLATMSPEVSSRSGDMEGPTYQGKDSDYYAQNFFRDFPVNPLTDEPDYLAGDIGSQGGTYDRGLVQSTNPNDFGDWITDPSGDPSGTRIPFDDPMIAGTRIPFPEQSLEEMAVAGHRVEDPSSPRFSSRHQVDPSNIPSSVTGQYAKSGGGMEGLLSPQDRWNNRSWISRIHSPDWEEDAATSMNKQPTPENGALLGDGTTGQTGYNKSNRFNNIMAQMLMQSGFNQLNRNRDW